MTTRRDWFEVDAEGLEQQLQRRGKAWALFELIQNALDADGVTRVDVDLTPIDGSPHCRLVVTDDSPAGFIDLSHAYRMFAPSHSAGSVSKRGRFNVGEKAVLAMCRQAVIHSTNGSVRFHATGKRQRTGERTDRGTVFDAQVRMTRAEMNETLEAAGRLIPPASIAVRLNGEVLMAPPMLHQFDCRLQTEAADSEGVLVRSLRWCTVQLFDAGDGTAEILEMGIPVVEADLGYRVNVLQKVPLNVDRDNVPPAFVKALQVAVVNAMADQLPDDVAGSGWVTGAIDDARCSEAALRSVVRKRFGDRAVVATPNDPLANASASAAGYTVLHGGSLPAGAWANARKHGVFQATGSLFPTPTPDQRAAQLEGAKRCSACGQIVA